jgi:hypothetical protein
MNKGQRVSGLHALRTDIASFQSQICHRQNTVEKSVGGCLNLPRQGIRSIKTTVYKFQTIDREVKTHETRLVDAEGKVT